MKDAEKSAKDLRVIIRMLLALPLLPKNSAGNAWTFLKAKLKMEGTENFVKYFERQWMGLAPQLWNFYQLEHRTTNAAEGYHSYLKRRNGSLRKPGFSLLYSLLQKLQDQQAVRIIHLQRGDQPRRPNPIYLKINESMKKLWEEYEEATKDAMHDESILSHLINFH